MGKGKSKKPKKHANKALGAIKLGKVRKDAERGTGIITSSKTPTLTASAKNNPVHKKPSDVYEAEILNLAERNHISIRGMKRKQEITRLRLVIKKDINLNPANTEWELPIWAPDTAYKVMNPAGKWTGPVYLKIAAGADCKDAHAKMDKHIAAMTKAASTEKDVEGKAVGNWMIP
ncbi:MAG: hypothetical protein EOP49_32180, partial [Sphingobacteriales bacterium]